MIERIAELARDKRIEGIAHVQDESDRFGVRVVIELKRDATPDVVLNQLFRFTPLQTSFGCNMLALNGGRPNSWTCASSSPPSSPSARRWSPAAPPSSCARPASAPMCCAASPSRCRTSTRWWRPSAPRPTRPRRASG
jgi:hypothetical protein